MNPDMIRTSKACIAYAKENGHWPSHKEWNVYAFKHGYYTAETLSYFGIWDALQAQLGSATGQVNEAEIITSIIGKKPKVLKNPPKNKVTQKVRNIWIEETNLRKARQKAGYSIASLAEKVGITKATLGEIENRQAVISLKEIELIANTLGVDFDYLKEDLLIATGKHFPFLKRFKSSNSD